MYLNGGRRPQTSGAMPQIPSESPLPGVAWYNGLYQPRGAENACVMACERIAEASHLQAFSLCSLKDSFTMEEK